MSSFTWTHTFNGQNFGAVPSGPGDNIYAGGGFGNSSNTAQVTEQVTFKGTWTPNPNVASDPTPASVIVEIDTGARSYGLSNGQMVPGSDAQDGKGDPVDSSGIAGGTHYKVETGASFTESLTLEASNTNSSGGAYADVGPVTCEVVNGNWSGPYYFHYGDYDMETDNSANGGGDPTYAKTNWVNNTPGASPTIHDTPDGKNLFVAPTVSTTMSANSEGGITPIWYWTGPDLGVPPPAFEINIDAVAYASNASQLGTDGLSVDDGIGNTIDDSQDGVLRASDSRSSSVTVQSDEQAPEEGNGYWAIGPPVNLSATADCPGSEGNGSASVSIVASITGPSH